MRECAGGEWEMESMESTSSQEKKGDLETKEKAEEWAKGLKMRHPKKAEKSVGRVVDAGED